MITILFVHQSSELYGSDKTLLFLLKYLDRTRFYPIVILPSDGPLKAALEQQHTHVAIVPVIKVYRKMFSYRNLWKFLKEFRTSTKVIDQLHQQYKFDLVYSNTLAVLLGHFFARKHKIRHVWHVHEIIDKPAVFKFGFCRLLSLRSTTSVVFNSEATKKAWNVNKAITDKSVVIFNGLETATASVTPNEINRIREQLFQSKNEIIIALVGRISRLKGQQILLKTFLKLTKTHSNIKLVFVGSAPPQQEIFLETLIQNVAAYGVADKVIILPYQQHIAAIWQAVDIAVVPSTEPESFGLVAVEAMLAKKPVIASNHGGLSEIVVHDKTGFLVPPGNEEALTDAIRILVDNPQLRNSFGDAGYERASQEFSIDRHVQKFESLFTEIVK